MVFYRGMQIRVGGDVGSRIQGRQGFFLRSASVNLAGAGGYNTRGISTSADPAVAFVYATNFAAMPNGAAVYAIWVDQGRFYRGIDVPNRAGIPAGTNMGANTTQQSVINQQEHVLQSVASHQIIGWYTITATDPHRLGVWNVQPHWYVYRFDPAVVNQAQNDIQARVNAKFPGGLSHARRATEIQNLMGPAAGVGF